MSNYVPNMTAQHKRFCDEYLVSFNAYQSAIAAGYSRNTAAKGDLLHTPKIQEYLKLKMDQRAERLEINHDMILREYAMIAFSNIGNYYDYKGDLKPISMLTEKEKAAVHYMHSENIAEPDGYIVGRMTKIKLHNKMAALDKIAKYLGFFEAGTKKSQESRAQNQEDLQAIFSQEQEVEAEVEEVELTVEEEIGQVGADVAPEVLKARCDEGLVMTDEGWKRKDGEFFVYGKAGSKYNVKILDNGTEVILPFNPGDLNENVEAMYKSQESGGENQESRSKNQDGEPQTPAGNEVSENERGKILTLSPLHGRAVASDKVGDDGKLALTDPEGFRQELLLRGISD